MRTRTERRLAKKYHRKKAQKSNWKDEMEDGTLGWIELIKKRGFEPVDFKKFVSNDVLSITICENEERVILGFRLNTEDKDIPWRVKQYWKNRLGYGYLFGYEAYPNDGDLFDTANMYWMVIPKEPISLLNLNDNFKIYKENAL